MGLAIGVLAGAGSAAAFVSDWFVDGLTPAIDALRDLRDLRRTRHRGHRGQRVENVVGIQLAGRNQADYALLRHPAVPLQIALVLAPVLVLAAPLVGASFTLVLSPLLIAVLVMAVIRHGARRPRRRVQLARRGDPCHALCPRSQQPSGGGEPWAKRSRQRSSPARTASATARRCIAASTCFARMLAGSRFDFERPMTGMEVELNLVDDDGDPALSNAEVLERIDDPAFQTELGRFNLEINVPPRSLAGDGAGAYEADVRAQLNDRRDQGPRRSARTW